MKLLSKGLKILVAFVIIFVIYTIVYHFRVDSSQEVHLTNTFIPSQKKFEEINDNSSPDYDSNQELNEDNIETDGFYIRIDRIDLFKPIVKNVDPRYKEVYTKSWETGVSHGKFTALPDQIGNTYLFAHAVSDASRLNDENAWFTRIDELVENDEIIIYYQGKKYTYQVSKIFSVSPSATGVYTGASPVPKITLQTCGPPRGSLDSRYMVEALQQSVAEIEK